jgi:probable AcnD-accessory protein PrpF
MRGGTSKGMFFRLQDLPAAVQRPYPTRDALRLRLLGSPDLYCKQIDGMGGATSSTSKAVILSRSIRPDLDVDYMFGQVSINRPLVDWSGNCGNLSAALGPFALRNGYVDVDRVPRDGMAVVRIWQANIGKTIVAYVPMTGGQVQQVGDFELDGVTFPSAEVQLEFMNSAAAEYGNAGAMFPTGHVVDQLAVPIMATLINAGIATIFVDASAIGYTCTELPDAINGDAKALDVFDTICAHGALPMGLIKTLDEAATRQHTPKIACVAPRARYTTCNGKVVAAGDVNLLVWALCIGKLHYAMLGSAAVAIGAAAAIPGTLGNRAAGGGEHGLVHFGYPSGCSRVSAQAIQVDGAWQVTKVVMSRIARVLMDGWVHAPSDCV